MAIDLEKLVVQLSADIRSYDRELARANGLTNNRMRAVERRHQAAARKIKDIWSGTTMIAGGLSGVLGVGIGIAETKKLLDSAKSIQNALRVTGLEGTRLTAVYDALFASAQRNSTPIESLVQLYSRLSVSAQELGVNQEQLLTFNEAVASSLRLGGTSAEQASGALLQLSQALGGGVVRAEEFSSILEGAPTILLAAAKGIKEANGSVAALRKLMLDGQLSSAGFFQGIIQGSQAMQGQLAGTESTISQRLIRLQNVLVDAAGKLDDAADASGIFGKAIDDLAATIQQFGNVVTQVGNSDLGGFLGWMNSIVDKAATFRKVMGGIPGIIDKMGQVNQDIFNGRPVGTTLSETSIDDRIAAAFEVTQEKAIPKGGRLPLVQPTEDAKPISLADYPVSGKGAKGGSKSARATADSRFADDLQAIRDRTAALIEEQKIVGLSYQEQEKRRMALDLEQTALADLREEARKKGQTDLDSIQLSDEQRAKIEATSTAYAQQADILRQLEDQQQRNEQAAGDFYDAFKSGAMDAITGAEDLGDALSNLAKRFGDLLLSSAFDSLFQPGSGGSSGGLFGGIFSGLGSLFGGGVPGRARGGPVSAGKPYIVGEERPELFVPGSSGRIIPQVPTMPSLAGMSSGSSAIHVSFAPSYNVTGTGEEIAALRRQMARDRAEFPSRAVAEIQKAQKKGVKV